MHSYLMNLEKSTDESCLENECTMRNSLKWYHCHYLIVHLNIICHSSFLCTHIYSSIFHILQNNNTATFTIALFFDRIQTNSYFFPLLRITQHTANSHSIVRQTERVTRIRPFASPVGWKSTSWFVSNSLFADKALTTKT